MFLLPKGDHYRTRLTHTLEVSQNARTMAKALRLNEDLVEAIALGHDLGHTPFGHAGERALNGVSQVSPQRTECEGRGMRGEAGRRPEPDVGGTRRHLEPSHSGTPHTLEGQVVRLSDKIAYINHDIDDAVRGGILVEEDIPYGYRRVLGNTSKERLDTMVHDVITSSMDKPTIIMSEEVVKRQRSASGDSCLRTFT